MIKNISLYHFDCIQLTKEPGQLNGLSAGDQHIHFFFSFWPCFDQFFKWIHPESNFHFAFCGTFNYSCKYPPRLIRSGREEKNRTPKPPKFSTQPQLPVPPDERVVEQEHDSPKISEPVQQEQHKWHLNNLKSAIPSQFHVARVSLSLSLTWLFKTDGHFLVVGPAGLSSRNEKEEEIDKTKW